MPRKHNLWKKYAIILIEIQKHPSPLEGEERERKSGKEERGKREKRNNLK
jgi:hypothetical protein